MSIDRRPSKKRLEAMRLAVNSAGDVHCDKIVAFEIWKELRWKIKIMPERTYGIEEIINAAILRCRSELKSKDVMEPSVQRLTEMLNRLSEFTIQTDEPDTTDSAES